MSLTAWCCLHSTWPQSHSFKRSPRQWVALQLKCSKITGDSWYVVGYRPRIICQTNRSFKYGYKLTDQLLDQGWASVALFTFMSYPVCCLTSTSGLIELKGRARSVKSKIIKHFLNDLSSVTLPLHENGESVSTEIVVRIVLV